MNIGISLPFIGTQLWVWNFTGCRSKFECSISKELVTLLFTI